MLSPALDAILQERMGMFSKQAWQNAVEHLHIIAWLAVQPFHPAVLTVAHIGLSQ